MSRRNEGKTSSSKLKSDRERYLDKSTSKLFQLKVCLDVLHEQGVDCDVREHLYKVEERRLGGTRKEPERTVRNGY